MSCRNHLTHAFHSICTYADIVLLSFGIPEILFSDSFLGDLLLSSVPRLSELVVVVPVRFEEVEFASSRSLSLLRRALSDSSVMAL